ncbi:Hypothetical protein NGAL_HAMBI1146_53470 [Neorhizobium galegae bv. officinalis]|nr:Hypothetical protein NGAL_HAMBI490_57190 [Neorhizobium galegae bv. officinalis]CDZ42580.1 Hypothetical protein NGAL_HAMBI1146_53470 [Neorhizobium galegae bv. officinalis]
MAAQSMLTQVQRGLTDAARQLGLDDSVLGILKYPRETLQARLTIRMDDGSSKPSKSYDKAPVSAVPKHFASTAKRRHST